MIQDLLQNIHLHKRSGKITVYMDSGEHLEFRVNDMYVYQDLDSGGLSINGVASYTPRSPIKACQELPQNGC